MGFQHCNGGVVLWFKILVQSEKISPERAASVVARGYSTRTAVGPPASNVCLVGEHPACSVHALSRGEGLLSYDYGHE